MANCSRVSRRRYCRWRSGISSSSPRGNMVTDRDTSRSADRTHGRPWAVCLILLPVLFFGGMLVFFLCKSGSPGLLDSSEDRSVRAAGGAFHAVDPQDLPDASE